MTTKLCGNCRYWQDKFKVEQGHKLGECCFNPPILQMMQVQQASNIQRQGGQGVNVGIQQLGLSPPALANRPGCHEHQRDLQHVFNQSPQWTDEELKQMELAQAKMRVAQMQQSGEGRDVFAGKGPDGAE